MTKNKDWTGNKNSVFKTLGASNHTDKERETHDFYATHWSAIDLLKKKIDLPRQILEPSCGTGCLSERLTELGHEVKSYDLIDRGYGEVQDFFKMTKPPFKGDFAIVTNPPYKYATEFVLHSLELVPEGSLVCLFLKTTFLESKGRYDKIFVTTPPSGFYSVSKGSCARKTRTSTICGNMAARQSVTHGFVGVNLTTAKQP